MFSLLNDKQNWVLGFGYHCYPVCHHSSGISPIGSFDQSTLRLSSSCVEDCWFLSQLLELSNIESNFSSFVLLGIRGWSNLIGLGIMEEICWGFTDIRNSLNELLLVISQESVILLFLSTDSAKVTSPNRFSTWWPWPMTRVQSNLVAEFLDLLDRIEHTSSQIFLCHCPRNCEIRPTNFP